MVLLSKFVNQLVKLKTNFRYQLDHLQRLSNCLCLRRIMSSNKAFIKFLGVDEMKHYKILMKQLTCEFLGVFFYVCLAVFASTELSSGVVGTALANGLLVATVVQLTGHVSGGHVNPAVTLGVMVAGQIKLLRALFYVAFQIFGSIAGAAVAYALTTDLTRGILGVTAPVDALKPVAACGLEFLMTYLLVAVVLSVTDLHRGAKGLGSAPLAIGLTVTACQCACLLYTGSLNPVRSLGPAVVMNSWVHHWIYWVGPMLGGFVAGLVFRYILSTHADVNNAE